MRSVDGGTTLALGVTGGGENGFLNTSSTGGGGFGELLCGWYSFPSACGGDRLGSGARGGCSRRGQRPGLSRGFGDLHGASSSRGYPCGDLLPRPLGVFSPDAAEEDGEDLPVKSIGCGEYLVEVGE